MSRGRQWRRWRRARSRFNFLLKALLPKSKGYDVISVSFLLLAKTGRTVSDLFFKILELSYNFEWIAAVLKIKSIWEKKISSESPWA
jgi:hypothetical protein